VTVGVAGGTLDVVETEMVEPVLVRVEEVAVPDVGPAVELVRYTDSPSLPPQTWFGFPWQIMEHLPSVAMSTPAAIALSQ
jgi:hypothetical protein